MAKRVGEFCGGVRSAGGRVGDVWVFGDCFVCILFIPSSGGRNLLFSVVSFLRCAQCLCLCVPCVSDRTRGSLCSCVCVFSANWYGNEEGIEAWRRVYSSWAHSYHRLDLASWCAGTYKDTAGSAACTTCPAGEAAPPGGYVRMSVGKAFSSTLILVPCKCKGGSFRGVPWSASCAHHVLLLPQRRCRAYRGSERVIFSKRQTHVCTRAASVGMVCICAHALPLPKVT